MFVVCHLGNVKFVNEEKRKGTNIYIIIVN